MWAVGDIFHLHHSAIGSTMTFVKGACALGLTLLFASLSYRFFETPFLRMKKRHEIIESRPV
jgi:peptidoglycan/LPS O-acetylase OafA/YrhL